MSFTAKSGQNSTLYSVSGTALTEFACMSWQVETTQEMQQFRNALTGTYSYIEPTFKDGTLSFSLDHNYAATPFQGTASGSLSIVGQGTNALHLFAAYDRSLGTSGGGFEFPSCFLTRLGSSDASEGKPVENYAVRANGAWIEPTT